MSFLGSIYYFFHEIPFIVLANRINARYLDIPAKKNRVNVFQYHPQRFGYSTYQGKDVNLGDSLGEVIINFILNKEGRFNLESKTSKTKHLFCVGTNIQGSYQNATIWGSGIYPPPNHVLRPFVRNLPEENWILGQSGVL